MKQRSLYAWVVAVLFGACSGAAADEVLLQAEDFSGPWRVQTNISGFLGKGFVTSNANPAVADSVMRTTTRIEQGGRHTVWVRGYTSQNSRRAVQVEINGNLIDKTHTGSDTRWAWEKAGNVELQPGSIDVVIHDGDDGFESVDAIMITDNDDLGPEELDATETQWRVYGGKPPAQANALAFTIQACSDALATREGPKTREEWETRRVATKQALAVALGLDPMPEKTPLNARVTGRADRELYTIENVIFESRPHFYVTANLYIPKHVPLPAPGIVVTAGHAMETGKNSEIYQMAQLGFVRQGFVVIAYDPIGQGERKVPGFDHPLGYGSLLVGRTNEGYIVWDTIRTLDYLVSRPEVDAQRIGLAGNSGGGESTFYTMPFDDRFQAAGSFCFVCSYGEWLRLGGNHCICNHLPAMVQNMEEFEIIGLNVPRAFLAGSGLKDTIFPIEGVRETYRRAQAIYALYDAAHRIQAAEGDHPHGWEQPLREAGYGWMNRWLQDRGDGSPVPEDHYTHDDPKNPDLLVLDGGPFPEDAKTMVELNQAIAHEWCQTHSEPPADEVAWAQSVPTRRNALWTCLGGCPPEFTPVVRPATTFTWKDCHVEALALTVETGLEIPALFLRRSDAATPSPVWLYVDPVGKDAVRNDGDVHALLEGGAAVLALDVRGLGEVTVHENQLTSDTICLGRPIFGQRVWDVLQAARYVAGRVDVLADHVCFVGREAGALLGIFATALGAPFQEVVASGPLTSFRYFIENEQPQPIWLGIPNLLRAADVAQVLALAAPVPVRMVNAIGYGRVPLALTAVREDLAFALEVYRLTGVESALSIEMPAEGDSLFP